MTTLRLLLAEPHALFRAGLRSLLEGLAGVTVVAEASDGEEALRLLEEHHPDIALIAVGLPIVNGIDVICRLRKMRLDVKVIVMSNYRDEERVCTALQAGSAGYLLKDAGVAELELAVRAVAQGDAYLSPPVARYVIREFVRRISESTVLVRLTPRHRAILQLMAEGYTTKATAQRLGVSVKTVENHRAEIKKRLDLHDVAGLVRYAARTGMVSSE